MMANTNYLLEFPNIRLACRSDNQEILDFLKTTNMNNNQLTVRYKRDPNFFSFLNYQGSKYLVYLFLDKDKKSINGLAVITVRNAYVNTKLVKAAYLSDLRISPKLWRGTRVQWKKLYTLILKEYKNIDQLQDVQYFYSAILSNNKAALNSLTKNKSDIIYKLISSYYSYNILGKIPLIGKLFIKKFPVHRASEKTKDVLLAFLHKCNKEKLLGYPFGEISLETELELNFRTHKWPNLSLHSFLFIKNKKGEIIACTAPLSSNQDRAIWIEKLSIIQKILGKCLNFFKGKEIKENQELKILYLTSLEFCPSLTENEQQNVFISFLNYIYANNIAKDHHLIQFLIWDNQNFTKQLLLKSYIHQTVSGYFYEVIHKDTTLKQSALKIASQQQIGFELFIS